MDTFYADKLAFGYKAQGRAARLYTLMSHRNKAATQASGLASTDDPVHIVLASDCLYDPSAFPMFKQSLLALCNPRTLVVMAYKRRLDRCDRKHTDSTGSDLYCSLGGSTAAYGIAPSQAVMNMKVST